MMKRILSLMGVALLIAFSAATPVYALVKSDDNIIIRSDEVIDDDLFLAGDQITIEGTVNGDIYAGANKITIQGTVNGDVIAGATTIDVSGTIRDDLRAAGTSISLIGAKIGDSLTVAGDSLTVDSASTVGGGLIFGGRSLSLDGSVGRGATIGSETTRIDSAVGNTVRIAATTIKIDKDAVIEGDLEYRSDKEAVIEGVVLGSVIRGEGGGVDLRAESFMKWFAVGYHLWAFAGALLIGLLMVALVPKLLTRSRELFSKMPGKAVAAGSVALLTTIPVAIILFITVIGIPLGFVLLTLWTLSIYFAKFFAAYLVGNSLIGWAGQKRSTTKPAIFLALLVGLVIYYALRIIPYAGVFVSLATTIVGLGMIYLLSTQLRPTKKPKL